LKKEEEERLKKEEEERLKKEEEERLKKEEEERLKKEEEERKKKEEEERLKKEEEERKKKEEEERLKKEEEERLKKEEEERSKKEEEERLKREEQSEQKGDEPEKIKGDTTEKKEEDVAIKLSSLSTVVTLTTHMTRSRPNKPKARPASRRKIVKDEDGKIVREESKQTAIMKKDQVTDHFDPDSAPSKKPAGGVGMMPMGGMGRGMGMGMFDPGAVKLRRATVDSKNLPSVQKQSLSQSQEETPTAATTETPKKKPPPGAMPMGGMGFGGFDPSAVKLKKSTPTTKPPPKTTTNQEPFGQNRLKKTTSVQGGAFQGFQGIGAAQNSSPLQKTTSVPRMGGSGIKKTGSGIKKNDLKSQVMEWAKRKTAHCDRVQVTNFTSSWANGIAYCAIVHTHPAGRKMIGDLSKLDENDPETNLKLAFESAEKLGVIQLMDAEDFPWNGGLVEPLSNVTYLSEMMKVCR